MSSASRPNPSFERGSELHNKALDNIRKLFEQSKDHISPDNLRLGERYLRGELELVLHLAAQENPDYSTHFCAVLWNGAREPGLKPEPMAATPRAAEADWREGAARPLVEESDCQQELMLVGNVELMQFPEIVTTSSVRLGSFDQVYRGRRDSLYFSQVGHFTFGRSLPNRKRVVFRNWIAIDRYQVTHQMVESTTKIVNGIACDQGETDWRVGPPGNAIDILRSLRVMLNFESVWVGFQEGCQSGLKLTDVVLGPFDFRPNLS